jgi:hypothetical protein
MRLHPRTLVVQGASADVGLAVADIADRHDLTVVEIVKILNEQSAGWIKHLLREERHPGDPDTRADEE